MKIVIDIPKILYGEIKQYGITFLSSQDKQMLRESIANGTPLPKGHGRLGDIDGIADYFREVRRKLKASDYKTASEFHTRDNMLLNTEQFIRTCGIIEADKERADDRTANQE